MNDHIIDFIDIELDIIKMKIKLSQEKLIQALNAIENTLIQDTSFHKILHNLLDFLFFYTRVTSFDESVLRNLFNFLQILSELHSYT